MQNEGIWIIIKWKPRGFYADLMAKAFDGFKAEQIFY